MELIRLTEGKRFKYVAYDASGEAVFTRVSKEMYIACTIDGSLFFTNPEHIGGEVHKQEIARLEKYDYKAAYRAETARYARLHKEDLGKSFPFPDWLDRERARVQNLISKMRTILYVKDI